MKVCYIAHPISGDLDKNIRHLIRTIAKIQDENPHIYAFAPYLTDVIALNDNDPTHRQQGLEHCRFVLENFPIDELWLTGDYVSKGMAQEIEWAAKRDIKVVDYVGFFNFNV